jgi:uncharacterized protein (DUF697 family)/GTP-binding protein EngB required for normal cell division
MFTMNNLKDLLTEAIQKAATERGQINVLIAGRSGVGKSTLINAIFQQNLAETGQGRPVTKNTREISKDGVPLSILDTRGLEMAGFKDTLAELEGTIRNRCADRDSNRHIHVAWLCVQEDARRIEDAETDLHNMLSNHVPLLTVITKARSDGGFRQEVLKLLPNSRNVVRVRAIPELMDDGHALNPMNLEILVEATSEVIPEGKRRAFAAAQKASLGYKKSQAHKIVVSASTAAAAAGATPIPFADAALLAPLQIGMIAGISSVFGLQLSKGTLATLVASAIGVPAATLAGRTIVLNLIKFIPGPGAIVSGLISATTAAMLTTTLGESYIAVLAEAIEERPDALPTAQSLGAKLKKRLSQ